MGGADAPVGRTYPKNEADSEREDSHRPCGRSAHRSCWLKNIQVGPRALLSYYCLCWIIKCPSHCAMVADWRSTARRL